MTIQELINKSKNAIMPNEKFQNKKYKELDCSYSIIDTMNGMFKLRYNTGLVKGWSWVDCLIKHCKECSEPIIVIGKSKAQMSDSACSRACKLAYAHARLEPIEYEGKIYTLDDCNATEKKRANPILTHVNSIKGRHRRMQNPEYAEKYRTKCAKNAQKKRALNPMTEEERLKTNKINSERYHKNPKKYIAQQKERIKNFTPEQKAHARKVKNKWETQDRIKNYGKYLVQTMINNIIQSSKAGKVKPISKYGFNVLKIRKHLNSLAIKMGYKNCYDVKQAGYDVDHIIPKYYYDLNNVVEMLKCNSIHNLRWLTSFENRSRGFKIRPQDLEIIKTLPKEIYPENFKLLEA
jgi:hypothetical protein